ncbi:MAG: hypothetical protein MRY83_25040, partial [Flavobacteriales bacterium]|nr:hypothetical protein [Flavobacteriales bacterium]
MISGVCLFLEEYKIHKENKELEQNLVDQLLDGKYYAYIQQEVQDKLKYSEKMFFQENHRASFNKRNPVERRNADTQLGNSQYRARIL